MVSQVTAIILQRRGTSSKGDVLLASESGEVAKPRFQSKQGRTKRRNFIQKYIVFILIVLVFQYDTLYI